jgi:hypothetical protein
MIELEIICPYTGLRSFSEEESLYFKGRDEQINRVIEQLERKKFLMVTGASGDGKSSLIFAGLIPQARAGFFKATYSNWSITSFRPERSPLRNMSKAVANVLQLEDHAVENELGHGFSSLMEIYKSSSLFIDQQDPSWQQASADKKLEMERKAGNLLIVVDQFEEFFTNPENFPNGVPSQDARLVLNILLETVKIALRDNLPIYIVFTMRSDYIGQCAAFRGLPEFIGFSQFFVPRLQRKELLEVIEEPAVLSGNRISKRLVDRLIYDLEDTEDHLPILQHVLKEIWKTAHQGKEEMDLIHYAMVGGMPQSQLPKENVERFNQWKSGLPAHQQEYLNTPGLSNVLDIHATRLYHEAATIYNKEHATAISDKEAKLIIGITFACLTRIDENRAVRNRMTLEEVTRIINVPAITNQVVDDILRPFRDPEHTLIRPFIAEGSAREVLRPNAVLDITHEALIRNWKLLNRWAAKEFEYYNTFIDFKKQLQRWIDNGQSSDYLLPIGPLTYFENWVKNCRPNAHWINRYSSETGDPQEKIKHSELTLQSSQKFLRKSAVRLFLTRAFMRYGSRKISLVAAAVALLITVGFITYSRWTKRNEVVVERILTQGRQLLFSPEADPAVKGEFVWAAERLRPGFLETLTKDLSDKQQQIGIALKIPELIFSRDKYANPPLVLQSIQLADSLINLEPIPDFSNVKTMDMYLNNWNDLLNIELNYLHFKSNPRLKKQFERNAKVLGTFLFNFFKTADPSVKWEKKSIHIAMAHTLNFHGLSSDSLTSLVSIISPFQGIEPVKKKFDLLFPAQQTIPVGANQIIEHNGGYESMAYLHASLGLVDHAMMCMDTILKYHPNYDLNWTNSRNVAAYFLLYGKDDGFKDFVTRYAKRLGLNRHEYVRGFTNRAGIFDLTHFVRGVKHGNFNPNLILFTGHYQEKVFDIYRSIIKEDISNPNERDFALALVAKQQGSVLAKKFKERKEIVDSARITRLFDEALALFQKLPDQFLESKIEAVIVGGAEGLANINVRRKLLFIYPDHLNIVLPNFSPGSCRFYGDDFFQYLNRKNLWTSFYKTAEDYALLNAWVNASFGFRDIYVPFVFFNSSYSNNGAPLDHSVFVVLDSIIARSGFEKELDNSWTRIQLLRDFLAQKEIPKALSQLDGINYDKLVNGARNFIETVCLHSYATHAAKELAQAGYPDRAAPFVKRFKRRENRIVTYAQLGIASYRNGQEEQAKAYLDSVNGEFEKSRNLTSFDYAGFNDLRTSAVKLIALLKKGDGRRENLDLTGSMGNNTVAGIATWVGALAEVDQYYEAESVIPELSNTDNKLNFYTQILYNRIRQTPLPEDNPWYEFDQAFSKTLDFSIYGGDNR